MSMFNGYSGVDPTNWLKEKSLVSLEIAASLADLANEPDTTPWYSKNLKRIASGLVSRLGPMVALFYELDQNCVEEAGWRDIGERGTFALAIWCKKWKIKNPNTFINNLTPQEKTDDEISEKSTKIVTEIEQTEESDTDSIKLEIYRCMSLKLLDKELSENARRILSWLMFHLSLSSKPDTVVISKRFLPTDIGRIPVETKEGYRLLYEKGVIEKVDYPDLRDHDIAIKLVVEGLNDSKHPTPYDENIEFGHPGIRISGEHSSGNMLFITFEGKLAKALSWLKENTGKLNDLKIFMQKEMESHNVYIENIMIQSRPKEKELDKNQDKGPSEYLSVQVYYPLKSKDSFVESEIKKLAEKWVGKHGFTVSN